jgi:SAM-dependent methyltransferase
MRETDETGRASVEAGQAVYSPLVLSVYDAFVLGFSNHLLWRCPTVELRALYDRNVGAHHLDIGVGTGYFLDRARWPVPAPAITLLDLNANSLAAAARRIGRYAPKAVAADALAPLPDLGRFDSVGLCYLLHCLPGAISSKATVFDHVRPLLAPGARVFGATIVQGDAPRSWAAQRLMDLYNTKGIFSNRDDRAQDLEAALESRFEDVRVGLKGAVALFEARVPLTMS